MGGGQQTTTQRSNNQPWGPAQPLLKTGLADAQTLYKQGVGGQPFTGSTVVPYAQQTTQGMGAIQNNANANLGGQGLSGQAQDIVGAGGFNAPQQQSMAYYGNVGTDPFDLSGNQAYQQYRSGSLDDVQDRVNMATSAAGRYGSGAHTANLVDELSNAGNRMDLAQMGRMDALNTQRFNAGQQGFQNLGAAYDLGNMPAQDLMDIGAMNEDLYGRQLNDRLRIFQETQNKPWEQIARLNAVGQGAGQFGTSTTTAQAPGQNPFLTGLGIASSGLGLLGSF